MKLSVIMPLYNQEKLFRTGLDSVPKSNDIEIIVIDDCSTDNSLEEVTKYREETGKNIVILHNKTNKGCAYSVNRGIDNAKGEYIIQLDSDGDYFVGLENALYFLTDADLIYCAFKMNDGVWRQLGFSEVGNHSGNFKFMRRDFIGDTREPLLINREDVYFFEDLRAKNPVEKYLDKQIMYVRYNYPREGSMTWNFENGITEWAERL